MSQPRGVIRSKPAVSVVIPVAGDAPFLAAALASIDRSVEAEVVIVEDGPLRNRALSGTPPFRQLTTGRALGPSAARNLGIREAQADLIAFLDADDTHTPGHLHRCFDALRTSRAGAVAGAARWVDADGEPLGAPDWVWEEFSPDGALGSLLLRNQIATPTVVARRDLLMRLGGFDPELAHAEDYDLWLRIAEASDWTYLTTVEAHVRRHGANTSRDLDAHLDAERRILERFSGEEVTTAFERLFPDSTAARSRALANHAFKIRDDGLLRAAAANLELEDPTDFSGAFLLGTLDLQGGRIEIAIERLQQGCDLPQAGAEIWNNLGVALCRAGRIDPARRAFDRARAMRPDYRDPALNLELIHAGSVGDLRTTGRLLRKALPPA